jgi:hypothetical protein
MSIGIVIAVPEGIVLSADSLVVLDQIVTHARDKQSKKEIELEKPIRIPVGFSKKVRKIFPLRLGNTLYAVCVSGATIINGRNVSEIIKSSEKNVECEQSFKGITDYLVDTISSELKKEAREDDLSKAKANVVSFILAGFKNNDPTQPIIESHIVFCGNLVYQGETNYTGHIIDSSNADHNKYGACWIGRSEYITHIVNHKNTDLPMFNKNFELMSLSTAAECSKFLVGFTCDFQEFAVTAPDCGRPIMTAYLTPTEYRENLQ